MCATKRQNMDRSKGSLPIKGNGQKKRDNFKFLLLGLCGKEMFFSSSFSSPCKVGPDRGLETPIIRYLH